MKCFFSFAFCTFFKIFHVRLGKKSKSVSFLRVYVCVKAKLTLVSFFLLFFYAPSPYAFLMLLSWAFWASCSQQCVSLCSDVDLLIWEFRGCISCVFPDDDVKHLSCDGAVCILNGTSNDFLLSLWQNSGTNHSHISECKGGNNWRLTTHRHMTLFEDRPRYDPFHSAGVGGTILPSLYWFDIWFISILGSARLLR